MMPPTDGSVDPKQPSSTIGGPGTEPDPVMAPTVDPGTPTPTAQPNIFDQSTGFMNQANQYLANNLGFQPMTINPYVIDPSQYQQMQSSTASTGTLGPAAQSVYTGADIANLDPAATAGYTNSQYSAASLGDLAMPTNMDAASVQSASSNLGDAAQMQANLLRQQELGGYMNPFTQNVIDNTMSRLGDARDQALNTTGAAATAGGAFGGDRHAIMEAQNNADYMRQVADTSGALNQQNFLNAQNMALQDVGAMNRADMANMQAQNQFALTGAGMDQQAALANAGYQQGINSMRLISWRAISLMRVRRINSAWQTSMRKTQ
jgi:hypothetical protein